MGLGRSHVICPLTRQDFAEALHHNVLSLGRQSLRQYSKFSHIHDKFSYGYNYDI